jgi:hypothetical protein
MDLSTLASTRRNRRARGVRPPALGYRSKLPTLHAKLREFPQLVLGFPTRMRGCTEAKHPRLDLWLTSDASWIEVLDQDRRGITLAVPGTCKDLDASFSSTIPPAVNWDRRPCIAASHRDVARIGAPACNRYRGLERGSNAPTPLAWDAWQTRIDGNRCHGVGRVYRDRDCATHGAP